MKSLGAWGNKPKDHGQANSGGAARWAGSGRAQAGLHCRGLSGRRLNRDPRGLRLGRVGDGPGEESPLVEGGEPTARKVGTPARKGLRNLRFFRLLWLGCRNLFAWDPIFFAQPSSQVDKPTTFAAKGQSPAFCRIKPPIADGTPPLGVH
jgi:hypothetical protein